LTKQIQVQFFTELQSQKQSQVGVKSVLFEVRISNSPLFLSYRPIKFNSCFSVVHSLNVVQ